MSNTRKNIFFDFFNKKFLKNAQVIVEFTFCMIVVFLMIYALLKIFIWANVGLVSTRAVHDNTLEDNSVVQGYVTIETGPLKQINPYFYRPSAIAMNAIPKDY